MLHPKLVGHGEIKALNSQVMLVCLFSTDSKESQDKNKEVPWFLMYHLLQLPQAGAARPQPEWAPTWDAELFSHQGDWQDNNTTGQITPKGGSEHYSDHFTVKEF